MGFMSSGVTAFFTALERMSADPKCPFDFDCGMKVNTTPWDFARNQIVDDFLRSPKKYTRLWFIDSDIMPQVNSIQLAFTHADIVAAPYPIWGKWGPERVTQIQWSVYEWNEEKQGYLQPDMPDEGILERDGAGTGMMIIKRHVFEDQRMKYPREYVSFTGQKRKLRDFDPDGWFQNKHKPNGQFDATEDLDFCYRARKLGYRILVDYGVKSGHIKQTDVLDVAQYSVEAYERGFRDALASSGEGEEESLIEVVQ